MTEQVSCLNGEEQMKSVTFRLSPKKKEEVEKRAGLIRPSEIYRRLVEMWLSGEVKIEGVDK
jgi:hypothetical protein